MDNVKLDILLSVYNGSEFLAAQIDSLLNQTYKDIQISIRDDGSLDKSLDIINSYITNYPDKICLLADNSGNVGVIKSFERLLASSNADYMMFCDQDDIWLPEKVQRAVVLMHEQEKIFSDKPIIICSDLSVVDRNLNIISDSFWKRLKLDPSILNDKEYLSTANFVTGCTMLFNKKAKEVSLPFGRKTIMHDAWMGLKVLDKGGIICPIPKSDILYRQHGANSVGAVEASLNLKYYLSKVLNIQKVIIYNYKNYIMAKECINISFFRFVYLRLCYLLKRNK
jgi:glycosyltransferase involved in cell wall biosynthesis